MDISVVIPLYNEEESIAELHDRLTATLSRMGRAYELLFVDDGSTDRSYSELEKLHRKDPEHVSVYSFGRNFGKSAALATGFERVTGGYVITMDADLQDDPAEIPNLIAKLEEGNDLVSGWKFPRHDPLTKLIPSRTINWLTAKLTGVKIHDMNCGLKAYRREVVKDLKLYGEQHRFIPALAQAGGFRVDELKVLHHPRKFGHTKFGGKRFIEGVFDLITVLFLTRYIRKPLHFFGVAGLGLLTLGAGAMAYLVVGWFMGRWIGDRPLFMLSVLLMILGVQFISTGLLGEMLTSLTHRREGAPVRRSLVRDGGDGS
ncbi:MAG: glycosyltransferase family 2 protein [Nitrospirae bacterium]|nr:glycosyltransferase family 2 protein [Nitrospirota bacterium]MBI5695198.1 glycosyltransferase family 2 protein [Nitrospirota bacterium]